MLNPSINEWLSQQEPTEEQKAEWAAQNHANAIKYASDNAAEFLRCAIRNVTDQLGDAKQFPEVVAAMVQASALGMIEMPDMSRVDVSDIAGSIENVAREICELSKAIHYANPSEAIEAVAEAMTAGKRK